MIDDITIAARVDGLEGVPDGMLPQMRLIGRPETHGTAREHGRLYITYCESTHIVTVRISVPRWLRGTPVNFPLALINGVDDLRLRGIAQHVLSALGKPVSDARRAADILDLPRWAVIRVSYAVDLRVLDPINSVGGCMAIHRKHGGRPIARGCPPSTIEWASDSLCAKLYDKQLEIRTHRGADEEEQAELDSIARRAARVLRFEVSIRQVRAMRAVFKAFNVADRLPTLALMCDTYVDRWVLTREADRLRLAESYESLDTESFGARARAVLAVLDDAQRYMGRGEKLLERRRVLTDERKRDLFMCHVLGSAHVQVARVAEYWGRSRSAVNEMYQELRALGIPPDASRLGTLGAVAEEIGNILDDYLLPAGSGDLKAILAHWEGRSDMFVPAPWADGGVFDEDDASGVLDRSLFSAPSTENGEDEVAFDEIIASL